MTRLVALGVAAALVLAGAIVLATSPWSEDEPEARMRTVPAEPEPVTLRVMTLNIFYGGDELDLATGDWCARRAGCQRTFDRVVAAVEASDADIVGLQETTMNAVTLAERLGWHASERTHVISRFPILDPPAEENYVLVEVEPGRVVAMANVHLPSTPYGPYRARDGASLERVLALEERVRVPSIREELDTLGDLPERGIPVFLTGDFNTPSHLDWTEAADEARDEVPFPVAWPVSEALEAAGFADSSRAVH